jgi:photosystem II stability/assembly factor-like uncharacterized protein
MGFTVAGPDQFLGSGHPDLRENLPPLLGLIESKNGGNDWEPVSLLGEADFHVLEASGQRVYGFDGAGGRFLVSRDGGRQWNERSPPEPLLSLAIHPDDPGRVIASGERELQYSADGGRGWRSLGDVSGLLAWPAAKRAYLLDRAGAVLASRDAGRNWRRVGEIGGEPAAFESGSADVLYAALHDGTIKQSSDGGETWGIRSRP